MVGKGMTTGGINFEESTAAERIETAWEQPKNITLLYRDYRDATLWAALSGDFHFDSDHAAYKALVTGDAVALEELTRARIEEGGVPNFSTADKRDGRRQARALLDAEWERMSSEPHDRGWDEPTGYCTDHGAYDPGRDCPGCVAESD